MVSAALLRTRSSDPLMTGSCFAATPHSWGNTPGGTPQLNTADVACNPMWLLSCYSLQVCGSPPGGGNICGSADQGDGRQAVEQMGHPRIRRAAGVGRDVWPAQPSGQCLRWGACVVSEAGISLLCAVWLRPYACGAWI